VCSVYVGALVLRVAVYMALTRCTFYMQYEFTHELCRRTYLHSLTLYNLAYRTSTKNLKGKANLGDTGVDERIILNCILSGNMTGGKMVSCGSG